MLFRANSSLPLELVDYIVDFLHDDKPALASCSLVCRVWVGTSRFHLFRTIHISYRSYVEKHLQKSRTLMSSSSVNISTSHAVERGADTTFCEAACVEVQFLNVVDSFIRFATTAPPSVVTNIRNLSLVGTRDRNHNYDYVSLPLGRIEKIARCAPALSNLTLSFVSLEWDRDPSVTLHGAFPIKSLTWQCPDESCPASCIISLLLMFPHLENLNWHAFSCYRKPDPVKPRSLLDRLNKAQVGHMLSRLSISDAYPPNKLLLDILSAAFLPSGETTVARLELQMAYSLGPYPLARKLSRLQQLIHIIHRSLEVLVFRITGDSVGLAEIGNHLRLSDCVALREVQLDLMDCGLPTSSLRRDVSSFVNALLADALARIRSDCLTLSLNIGPADGADIVPDILENLTPSYRCHRLLDIRVLKEGKPFPHLIA